MVKSVVKRKATPSSLRRKKAQQRIRKKIATKAAKKKPSWKASLKNVYNKKKIPGSSSGEHPEGDEPSSKKRPRYQNEEGDEVQDDVDEDKMKRMNERNPLETQLFLKHLPFDTNEAELLELLRRYGPVQRVFLTRSHATKQLTGTGFVHCGTVELADTILKFATQNSRELSSSNKQELKEKTEKLSHHQTKKLQFKLRGDTVEIRDPFIMVRETRVTVHKVLSRTDSHEAVSQAAKKKKKTTSVAGDDPRNLYLLQEGRIEAGTPAAKGLPERYVQLLGQDYEQRRLMLKDTNMFVSKTRLNVRNLPKKYTDRDVRKLFSDHARNYLKKHKEDMDKEKWGKYGPIKNVKLLSDGNGVSKGYAFVEFVNHNVALNVLRQLNNNPTLFGEQNRLVVSFAIENINAIQKLERIREIRQKKMGSDGKQDEY